MLTIRQALEQYALELAEKTWPTKPVEAPVVVREGPRAWFVLQTVSRGEDKAKEALEDAGYLTLLPTMRRDIIHHRTGKKVRRSFKLFNRYLLAELPQNPRYWSPVRKIEEIDCALGCNGMPVPVPQREIDLVLADQAAGKWDELMGVDHRANTLKRFSLGSRARAKDGPFGGFAGLVTNVHARGSLDVLLDIFGRMTPVEFEVDQLEVA